MSIHDGHRDRLRKRFVEHGLDNFNELNALELLLFYAIPRRDTNVIAHNLLEHFGDLQAVFSATQQELQAVDGIGENAAALIMLVPQIVRKSMVSKAAQRKFIKNSDDAGKFLLPRFMFEEDEILLMLCMDSQRRLISCNEMSRGVVNSVEANVRRIVETALKQKAVSVIIAHNHPDGIALPSREDDMVTQQVYKSLQLVGIALVDHIIVAGEDYVSYADSGMMNLYRY